MTATIHVGDALATLRTLPEQSVNCCVTSPPYWGLRDYGVDGQIGLEDTPQRYVEVMVAVFAEVRRVLRDDGVLWLNLGDSYVGGGRGGGAADCKQRTNVGSLDAAPNVRVAGLKTKDLCGMPWRVAFALQADGWWLRSDCIWSKPNPMPESVTDRPTKAHEYVFLLSKSAQYFYDGDAVRDPLAAKTFTTFGCRHRAQGNDALGMVKSDNWGRTVAEHKPKLDENGEIAGANMRTVWSIASQPFAGAHFATMPEALAERCVLAGSPDGGTVLDPFCGAGTTGVVSVRRARHFVGIELNPTYAAMARRRITAEAPLFVQAKQA
jgi:site-specific DNA-methyltransferase (cytosine-N4-specific)